MAKQCDQYLWFAKVSYCRYKFLGGKFTNLMKFNLHWQSFSVFISETYVELLSSVSVCVCIYIIYYKVRRKPDSHKTANANEYHIQTPNCGTSTIMQSEITFV